MPMRPDNGLLFSQPPGKFVYFIHAFSRIFDIQLELESEARQLGQVGCYGSLYYFHEFTTKINNIL